MNANGACRHRVTRSGTGHDFDPSWAPDGTRLVFRTSRGHYQPDVYGNGLEGLFVVNVDGSHEREIQPPTGGMSADWSPRGDKIAFSGLRSGRRYDTLFLMNPDGSGAHDLGTPRGSEGAVWSPDASHIQYGAHKATATGRLDDALRRQPATPADTSPAPFRRDEPLPRFYWIKPNGTGIRSLPLLDGAGDPIEWLPHAAPDPRCS